MRAPALRRALSVLKFFYVVVAASALAGCGQVFARESDDIRISFIASSSPAAAAQERSALRVAFTEANQRHIFGRRRIVLEEDFARHALAVITGRTSADEDWAGQIAFLDIGRRADSDVLQAMQSINCTAPHAQKCTTGIAAAQRTFERSFRALTGMPPREEAYVAYAEAQSVFAAIQRLIAEDALSAANVRRALVFGEFSTLLGNVRYALPPDMLDEVTPANSVM